MTDEEYLNVQTQVLVLSGLVAEMDLEGLLECISRAEAVGPVLDPTLPPRAYNHCLLNDPIAREMSRVGIIRVLVESAPAPSIYVVVGLPGDMLYCTLAGHFYAVQHPRCAHPMLARLARATIECNRARAPGWAVAWQVITAWGPMVQPWLGVTKLDERGTPLTACREYGERLPL